MSSPVEPPRGGGFPDGFPDSRYLSASPTAGKWVGRVDEVEPDVFEVWFIPGHDLRAIVRVERLPGALSFEVTWPSRAEVEVGIDDMDWLSTFEGIAAFVVEEWLDHAAHWQEAKDEAVAEAERILRGDL